MGTGRNYFLILISLTILFLHLLDQTNGHFLSVEDLEEFYDLEEKLASTFTTFVEEQKQILEVVKQRYEEQKRRQPVVINSDEYLANPLNVLAMLKRMVSDWPLTLALLGGALADEEDESINLPNIDEYRAALHGIARIQLVYRYGIKKIVNGTAFPNTDSTSLFNADDSLALGTDFYDNKHYGVALAWFKEALNQTISQNEGEKFVSTNTAGQKTPASPPLQNIYEYLALAACFKGDQRQSRKYFRKLYNEFPEFRPTPELIHDHLLAVNDSCSKLIDNGAVKPIDHKLKISWQEDADLSANYSQLCRAVTLPDVSRSLSCRLEDWGMPYWRLQPFKIEDLHRNPNIHMTYSVISPAESQFLMEKMMDEEIQDMKGFVYEFWQSLPENSTVSASLIRRTERFTGATVHNTDTGTVLASLPPGAEYVIDIDVDEQRQEPAKYRLGSSVYFLQQAQAGGFTVFPRLGLSIAPVAGAALTWYNVNRKGKVDPRTVYGKCPILQGHQTTLTLWFKRAKRN